MKLLIAFVVLAVSVGPTPSPSPPNPTAEQNFISGQILADKATLTGVETRGPGDSVDRSGTAGAGPATPVVDSGPAPEYRDVPDCPINGPSGPNSAFLATCQTAIDACAASPDGPGIMTYHFSRPPGSTTWTALGKSCTPDRPDTPAAALPALAEIQRAFNQTPFATPTGATQPPGGKTLINLPTYFALTWPPTGYRPGQTRTLTLLGHTIDLHLNHGGHTYDFGDGTTLGPTPSPGGPYPTGDITHTYRTPATLTPTATTTITADYRIDGGPWHPLPGQSTQTTTFPTLTILSATNHLHPNT